MNSGDPPLVTRTRAATEGGSAEIGIGLYRLCQEGTVILIVDG